METSHVNTIMEDAMTTTNETKTDERLSNSTGGYLEPTCDNAEHNQNYTNTREENEPNAYQRQKDQDITSNTKPPPMVPPDGGWGWLVTLGSVINIMLTAVIIPCFSILYYETLMGYGASSTTVAWIYNCQMFIWHMLGPWVMPLVTEFGWRKVAALGIFCVSSSFIISSFAVSAEFLFFSFSLLSGFGSGLAATICFNIVPTYFVRRRGLSNAMVMAGVSFSQILGPPFVRFLQEEYSAKGALLVMGAIVLNGLVGLSFYHPVQWHMKPDSVEPLHEPLTTDSVSFLTQKNMDNKHTDIGSSEKFGQPVNDEELIKSTDSSKVTRKMSGRILRERGLSESSGHSVICSTELTIMYSSHINNAASEIEKDDIPVKMRHGKNKNIKRESSCLLLAIIARVGRYVLSDLKILRSRRAAVINLGVALVVNAQLNFTMMVPFCMRAAGYTLQDASYAISVMGTVNMLSRLLLSPLSDFKWFNMTFVYMTGQIVMATTMLAFPFVDNLKWIYVVMGLYGLGLGITIGFNYLIMIKYMGIENLGPTLGTSSVCVAIGLITTGPLIGLVRDITQSYAVSVWVLSGMIYSCFLFWIFMPAAVTYDSKKALKNADTDIP